jgi:16S rRNA (uracil1498-N3)-methyltransferase
MHPTRTLPRCLTTTSLQGRRAGQDVELRPTDVHHLTRVRRLNEGADLEVVDESGWSGRAILLGDGRARLRADPASPGARSEVVVIAAVPKGSRGDWMAEKLGEVGVRRWVPLVADRSVVKPGAGKMERWRRLAVEAAKQSGAAPMSVDDPLTTDVGLAEFDTPTVLTTERPAGKLHRAAAIWIGPEGGWSERELSAFDSAGAAFARLTDSVLRVETAAVLAAGILRFNR